ncbi:brca2 and cdkn1a interacting protein [Holotrichia oblita]|uniref:Brca2 and cdkn1a interacting protein n=2 Tax=Holotrichia oblita TaxID=644536 RepID=A0ACB9T306_HOLOL|nr:brca2 and cdkn1a interacting protein [Holotrichia oblita]KAI4461151.1 brca2 and cdkn1a interacting protein [Holotrichia oblita]
MAGPPKRRAVAKDSESSENSSDEENYTGQEMIQADFEGRNPEVQDFHGIKQLLQQLFLKAHIELSQMTDMLIAQTGVGSVLKQSIDDAENDEDDDMSDSLDVFGITSVLNLSSHKDTPCIQQLFSLLEDLSKKHADVETQNEIKKILSCARIGLLINERFVNIPAKVSDPLLTSLTAEIDRIQKKDASYAFEYLIMICKLHKSKGDDGEIIFANGEEEIFAKEAEVSFLFNVSTESDTSVSGKWSDGDVEMIPHRKILFIKGNKLNNIVQKVKTYVE